MWTKLLAVGAATVLAIKASSPPNPATPKDPSAKVVDEGLVAAFVVHKAQILSVLFYGIAFGVYVWVMWQQEAGTITVPPSFSLLSFLNFLTFSLPPLAPRKPLC
jgi:hypothetical protein